MNQLISTNQLINQSTNKNKKFDIHDRIFLFVVNTLKILGKVPVTVENKIIINQLVRSVTSVGANDQEADGVSTKRDFIHCYTVVRKELKETEYWLKLLAALNSSVVPTTKILLEENKQLINIISTIIKNSSSN